MSELTITLPGTAHEQEPSHDVASEAALLILCLRGVPLDIPAGIDWQALQALAEQNGVLLPVYSRLMDLGANVPESLQQAVLAARASAEAMAAELERLLRAFQQRGIEVLPLKGPALALALYGDAAMRPANDLDLLVRSGHFPRAEALLLDLGFAGLGAAGDHDRRFLRGKLLVELHFALASPRFFPFEINGIWSRSSLTNFRGLPVRAMSPNDLVFYLCAHGLKHGFSRLIWILDLAHALRGWASGDYRALVNQAQSQGLLAWLLIGCEVVRIVLPEQMPEGVDAAVAESPAALRRARRAALMLFPKEPDAEGVDYRALYLQAEASPVRRWRYRLQFLAPTRTDEIWAQRHRIHPRLMFLLRPIRLMGKHGLARVWRMLFGFRA
jgi:hypothetical protein